MWNWRTAESRRAAEEGFRPRSARLATKARAVAAEASSASPEETCGIWQDAEAELINRFDVFPVTDNILPTYQSGAVFEQPNFIQPTSIRMLG